MNPFLQVWVDSASTAVFEDVQKNKPFKPFSELPQWQREAFGFFTDQAVWAFFDLENASGERLDFRAASTQFSVHSGEIIVQTLSVEPSEQRSAFRFKSIPDFAFSLQKGQKARVWLRFGLELFGVSQLEKWNVRLYSEEKWRRVEQKQYDLRLNSISFQALVVGAIWVFLLFALINFLIFRERAYFAYAFYLIVLLAYNWPWYEVLSMGRPILFPCPIHSSWQLEVFCTFAGYMTYFRFLSVFHASTRPSRALRRFLFWSEAAIYAVFVGVVLLYFLGPSSRAYGVYVVARLSFDLLNFVAIALLFLQRETASKLLAMGVLTMSAGLTISFLGRFGWLPIRPNGTIWGEVMTYFNLGILCEILFFTTAVIFNFKFLKDEKIEAQNQLTQKLSAEVELRRKLANAEITALRAQINPHFFFNSLSALNHFILAGEAEKGSSLLTKFASLMRAVLENSRKPLISLDEELRVLEQYLLIEQIRTPEKFEFNIQVDPKIDPDSVLVPPMILQPFAENSIKHGFLNSPRKSHRLMICARPEADGFLILEMTDDGIGRDAARAADARSAHLKNQSLGLKITLERIQMANGRFNERCGFEFEDLFDAQGRAAGTRVVVRLERLDD